MAGVNPEYIRKDGELTFEQPNYPLVDNNYGVATFMLTDFLKPNVRKVKLLSHIVPIFDYIDNEKTILDLNTTAMKKPHPLKFITNYLDCESFMVVTFDIAK